MMHDEAQAVLAAYALDAVEPPEREELETHLEGCPRCRSELSGYQEVTGMLAGGGAEVPAGLWDRIASQLGEAPPPLRLVPDGGASRSRWPRRAVRRLGAAALVAAAAAAAVLGLQVSHLESRVAHLQVAVTQGGVGGLVEAALAEPGTRRLELRSPSRAPVAEVVVRSNGQAFLVDARMPDLASGRTYQLWGLSGSHPVSLGLLGRKAQATVFRVDDRISTLMVTAEPAGGVSLPDSPVLATVRLAAD